MHLTSSKLDCSLHARYNLVYVQRKDKRQVHINAAIDTPRKLSQQIFRVLQDRINRGKLPCGIWLRETHLAREFDVSRYPVRSALEALVECGMAERLTHRGVRVICATQSAGRGKPVATDMRTLSEKATDVLLKKIVASGSDCHQTSVTELAKELGISRTPVRRALDRLTQLGLAECALRGRVYLGRVDADRVSDVYDVRAELEGMAAEYAATQMDTDVLNQLAEANRELAAPGKASRRPRMVSQEFRLHHSIAEYCGQAYLQKLLRDIFDLVSAFQRAGYGTDHMADRAVHEHGLMISALQKQDGKLARQRMIRHIRTTCRQIMIQMK